MACLQNTSAYASHTRAPIRTADARTPVKAQLRALVASGNLNILIYVHTLHVLCHAEPLMPLDSNIPATYYVRKVLCTI